MIRSFAVRRVVRLALACLAALAASPAMAACPVPRNHAEFEAMYAKASGQRHDTAQLTCAAVMSANMAARRPALIELQLLALDAQINLLDALAAELDSLLYRGGDAVKDIKARWSIATRQGQAVSKRLGAAAQGDPSVATALIAFKLASVVSSLAPAEVAFNAAARAIEPLSRILAKAPDALEGGGQLMLGRLYLQLPESAGGDLDKSISHLEAAYLIAPTNMVFQRWLIEGQVALGRHAEAQRVLAEMLRPEPSEAKRQEFADELRAGVGLAQRAGDAALADRLAAKRASLLTQYPYLQTRQTAAVLGHGGVDPMTGKPTD